MVGGWMGSRRKICRSGRASMDDRMGVIYAVLELECQLEGYSSLKFRRCPGIWNCRTEKMRG